MEVKKTGLRPLSKAYLQDIVKIEIYDSAMLPRSAYLIRKGIYGEDYLFVSVLLFGSLWSRYYFWIPL